MSQNQTVGAKKWSAPLNTPLPIILIRGFGGLGVEDEKRLTYQGFNDGTVYPRKQGENYIYEGLILRFMKSDWEYHDATNVVGYYDEAKQHQPTLPDGEGLEGDERWVFEKLKKLNDLGFFHGDKVIIDPAMARALLAQMRELKTQNEQNKNKNKPAKLERSLWVFRYYDLNERTFSTYGRALVRLINFIRELGAETEGKASKVNIIAHSMGGLIVREAIQNTYRLSKGDTADQCINKIVTLGTPHGGISFQVIKNWANFLDANEEMERFNPDLQEKKFLLDENGNEDPKRPNFLSFHRFGDYFPVERLLTVVGTNYRSYAIAPSSWLNRAASMGGEFGANYNRSDGLVKQSAAQIPGAPRTFVHKCHGGEDSLVTARESFEIATRFFFGNVRARLSMISGAVTRGHDLFGKSEFFFGVSIKPRGVDFDLFHQSSEAENCYGPFSKYGKVKVKDKETGTEKNVDCVNFSETDAEFAKQGFGWAGPGKLIWEGYLDTSKVLKDPSISPKNMVMRLDFYVSERDLWGIGFSDNMVFRKQYYLRAILPEKEGDEFKLYRHADEKFTQKGFKPAEDDELKPAQSGGGWEFPVEGTGFQGVFRIDLEDLSTPAKKS